jgi:hypothetical protein
VIFHEPSSEVEIETSDYKVSFDNMGKELFMPSKQERYHEKVQIDKIMHKIVDNKENHIQFKDKGSSGKILYPERFVTIL